jgi:predicted transcriptional regulator
MRDKWDILADGLKLLMRNGTASETELAMSMGVTTPYATKYIHLLEEHKHIRIDRSKHGQKVHAVCTITEKGIDLNKAIQHVYDLVRGETVRW